MANQNEAATGTPTAPGGPGTTAEPQRRISVTYTRAVAWNYGNKEEGSVTLTETLEPDADLHDAALLLQAEARRLVTGLLAASGVQLVADQLR